MSGLYWPVACHKIYEWIDVGFGTAIHPILIRSCSMSVRRSWKRSCTPPCLSGRVLPDPTRRFAAVFSRESAPCLSVERAAAPTHRFAAVFSQFLAGIDQSRLFSASLFATGTNGLVLRRLGGLRDLSYERLRRASRRLVAISPVRRASERVRQATHGCRRGFHPRPARFRACPTGSCRPSTNSPAPAI